MGFESKTIQQSLSSSSKALPPPPLRDDTDTDTNTETETEIPLLGNSSPNPLSSQSKTFANFFIAIVGAGVLGLPYSFKRTGWFMGLLILFSVSFLSFYSMMLLVYTRRKLHLRSRKTIHSFGDVGFAVCGSFGRFLVDLLVVLSQAGFCVGYLIFIADTLSNVFNHSSSSSFSLFSPKTFYISGCFPFQLGLNSIRSLTQLAPLSIFADVVDLAAMAVVLVDDVSLIFKNRPQVRAFGSLSTFFYGMGVAVYAFEGIGMVLPIESEMKDKHEFAGTLASTMLFITFMYGGFGALGYLAFGEQTRDIITANLGPGLVTTLVQLALCANLFFTFPLMMNPVYEIVERRFWGGSYCVWLRWLSVLVVSLVGLLVPNFADFLSLVGSSVCCGLGFVLPAFFHILTFKEEMGWMLWSSDVGIVALGLVLAVSGTWNALLEIFSVKV